MTLTNDIAAFSEYRWLLEAVRNYLLGSITYQQFDLEISAMDMDDPNVEALLWREHAGTMYLYAIEVGEGIRSEGDLLVAARTALVAMAPLYQATTSTGHTIYV